MRHSLAVFLLLTLTACSTLDDLDPTKRMPVNELYALAKESLDGGDYENAIKQYETLQARYPYGRYAQQALLETAYAYHRQNEPEQAISTIDRFIKQYPHNQHVDYAYYLKGLANFNAEVGILGSLSGQDPAERDPKAVQDSFAAFKDLVTRFPDSKYAPDSRIRMLYLSNALAKHELHIARYYLRRGAHIAAVNRAQGILIQFPNSPSTIDALKILVQSYDAMGMNELRDDARRVLEKNSGTSSSGSTGGTNNKPGSEKSWWQIWK